MYIRCQLGSSITCLFSRKVSALVEHVVALVARTGYLTMLGQTPIGTSHTCLHGGGGARGGAAAHVVARACYGIYRLKSALPLVYQNLIIGDIKMTYVSLDLDSKVSKTQLN